MKLLRILLDILLPKRLTARIIEELSIPDFMKKIRIGVRIDSNIIFLLSYASEKVRACIQEAKFHENTKAFTLLGRVLKKYLDTLPPHILVPVPLSNKRKQRRGYNQVEEVLKAGKLPYQSLLIRTRDTLPQTTVPKALRRHNLQDAFICPTSLSPIPIYVLVDDVTTTGATLQEAEKALRAAGALQILLISLTH